MLLIEDDAMALDDHVARWIPELAHPRVLRMLESELGDTVPADRPITYASGSLVSILGDLWAFASNARRGRWRRLVHDSPDGAQMSTVDTQASEQPIMGSAQLSERVGGH